MRVLLVTPPLIAPNAPYPATPMLYGFLRRRGVAVRQVDLSIWLLRRVFSAGELARLAEIARRRLVAGEVDSPDVAQFLAQLPRYVDAIDGVVAFLSGATASLPVPLPEGRRFDSLANAEGILKGSLFLDDVADFYREAIDAKFGFSRYADHLASSATHFRAVEAMLEESSPFDLIIDELAEAAARRHAPDLLAITVPFPGTLLGALRVARVFRKLLPETRIVLGGGYVSTELRDVKTRAIFKVVDRLIFDQGMEELLGLAQRRTRTCALQPHRKMPPPEYAGLLAPRRAKGETTPYFAMQESPNFFSQLWSARFWNRLTLAHGCYWHRCAFCDTTLDYIGRFDAADAPTVIKWMDAVYA
ncbi:MAG: hypothetical protein FWF84_07860, partial [Kiritimatiellaeota bacterium]|nr:hypothetical protein [Kiritimatiellota bacterium]